MIQVASMTWYRKTGIIGGGMWGFTFLFLATESLQSVPDTVAPALFSATLLLLLASLPGLYRSLPHDGGLGARIGLLGAVAGILLLLTYFLGERVSGLVGLTPVFPVWRLLPPGFAVLGAGLLLLGIMAIKLPLDLVSACIFTGIAALLLSAAFNAAHTTIYWLLGSNLLFSAAWMWMAYLYLESP